jgi:hypothetical protein
MASQPINFRCRECGNHQLFEVMKDVVVTSECSLDGEYGVQYDEQTNEDGEVLHYMCGANHIVKDAEGDVITDGDALVQQFSDHPIMSHDEVVALIADRLKQVDAETLVEEFNRAYPADALKSLGDSMYVRGNQDED